MAADKKTVLYITGTRADFNLMQRVLDELTRSEKIALEVLVTGMHTLEKFGNTIDEVRASGIPVAAVVPIAADDSMSEAIAKEIKGIGDYCLKERPDAILLLGDRGEMVAAATVATYLRIPVIHIHGGDISGEVDDVVRHAITKLSHIHFPATDASAARILRMGEEPWRVRVIGAPGVDRLKHIAYKDRPVLAKDLGLDPSRDWITAILHPSQEGSVSVREQTERFFAALTKFPEAEKIIIYPNSDTGYEPIVEAIERLEGDPRAHAFKNLGGDAFPSVLKESAVLAGNSSSGVIESGFFKLPTVNVGDRQRGRERDQNVIDTPFDLEALDAAFSRAMSKEFKEGIGNMATMYDKGNTAQNVVAGIEELLAHPDLLQKAAP